MSYFQGNPPYPDSWSPFGVSGTEKLRPGAAQTRGFRNRLASASTAGPDPLGRSRVSGYWEPRASVDQEPRITGYSGPTFVVTGTDSRGFRNQALEKRQIFQVLKRLSTPLNALTSFSNRLSLNAAAAEATGKAPPLGGFAPAGSYGPSGLRPRFALPPGIPKQPKPGLRPRALRSPFQSSPASGGFMTSP